MSSPHDRDRLIGDGCVSAEDVECDVCREPIEPGELAMCGDGYERVYGEFVLDARDDLHEDNWPASHAHCSIAAVGAEQARGSSAHAKHMPRAVALHDRDTAARLVRARAIGLVWLGLGGVATAVTAFAVGLGPAVLVMLGVVAMGVVGVGLAARPSAPPDAG